MNLAQEFHRDMVDTYTRAKRECNYHATLFMKMVSELGGLQTARILLSKPNVSEGFTILWEKGRLDLSVEARVLDPRYRSLFTLAERQIAWQRLKDYGYLLEEPKEEAAAEKGSRKRLQELVNQYPGFLNCLLLSSSASLRTHAFGHPEWLSPLKSDEYREYQDARFLEVLGLAGHTDRLGEFWPHGGPVWDGLARVPLRSGGYGVILLEAKAHLHEVEGPGCRATSASREKIERSLNLVKQALGVDPGSDWLGKYYQYANRLAHLYFFNGIIHIPAWLVTLYFVGDVEMNGPQTVAEWMPALSKMKEGLGLLDGHLLQSRVITVFCPACLGA